MNPSTFKKDAVGTVDHDLADGVIEDEMFDRFEKWKNGFKPVHQSAPSSSCWKYDLFGIVVIGFEITERRRDWIQTVVGDDHGLRVAQAR